MDAKGQRRRRGQDAGKGRAHETFQSQLEELRPQLFLGLFEKARQASRLAKTLTGAQRRRAYRIKNRALKELVLRGGATTELDWYRYPGLVSVALDRENRLHTSTVWIREAEQGGG